MKISVFFSLVLCGFLVSCTTDPVDPAKFSFDADGNTVLQPPPPGEGIQLVIGPFDVPIGSEIQREYYLTMPFDEEFNVGKIEIAMNEGTHHMNFFRSTLELPDTLPSYRTTEMEYTAGGKTWKETIPYEDSTFYLTKVFNASDMLIEAQISGKLFTWDLPKLPNGKQSVINLRPHEKMLLQVHYVNAVTQKTSNHKGKVTVNIWKAKGAPSNFERASMCFARNMKIFIPPNSEVVFTKDCKFNTIPRPMYILGMTGHFHSRGKSFTIDKMYEDPVTHQETVVEENIYQSSSWSEPPFTPYDPPIELKTGEFIRYKCVYNNPTNQTFVFGPKVDINEHMNLFIWFTPAYLDGRTLYDTTQ
jgi:hypothetical protein